MKNLNISVTQIQGCDVKCSSDSHFSAAVSAAKSADVVVVVVGLDESQERYKTLLYFNTLFGY